MGGALPYNLSLVSRVPTTSLTSSSSPQYKELREHRDFAGSTRSARHGTDHTLPKHLSIIIRVLIELPRWGTDIQRCASCLEFVPAPSCKDLTSQVPLPRRCGP
ncbi:hypothetical protein M405DRAFT_576133 [Rhizopogon salebrosus TDB-379]|nr:hypothetical protein M405DRAFT_576133 [Rhizopogon salebrosus TDB-379]